jgi:hypothetical protein
MMTLKDLEKVQKTFKEAGQDYQVELESGTIIIVGPSDIVSSESRNSSIISPFNSYISALQAATKI